MIMSDIKSIMTMTKESQNIEFKESWRDEYLKWICGFANAQGGTLYFHAGEIEAWGRGIERIVATCKNAGYPEPQFDYDGGGLWTIFHFGKEYVKTTRKAILNEGVNEGVNEGDNFESIVEGLEGVTDVVKKELLRVLKLFGNGEGLKLKDVALRIGRSTKSVERYLKILKDLSLIEFRGSPRNGKYYSTKF